MLSLSATLLFLCAAPAPRLHEGLPPAFQVDGKLDEWKQPASLTLGAANQVAGAEKVTSPEDLSARVWLALGPAGLAIAGEVRDDAVLLTNTKDLPADHVEVWLALPPPVLPPLGYSNHLGDILAPTPALCDLPSQPDPVACRAWWAEQTARRTQLQRELVAWYSVTPSGVVRHRDTATSVGTARYEPFPGGYRFEALIPIDAFPATAQAPLKQVRLMVDLVDSDEGGATQETLLSSSPTRRPGDASTFHAVTLSKPLRFGGWPELLELALKQPGTSYVPGSRADLLQAWVTPAVGYQYVPQAPSPQVVEVDLSQVKPVAKLGDVELVLVPLSAGELGSPDRWLVSRRGRTVLHTRNVSRDEVRVATTARGARILQTYFGTTSPLGHGACGACPLVDFQTYTLDTRGRFSKAVSLDGAGGMTGVPVEWTASPDLSRIDAFDVPEADEDRPRGSRRLIRRHTLNAKTGQYATEFFSGQLDE